MTFMQNHEPKTLNDLVFHDTKVRQIIHDYANGSRTKHLLLHGPVGTGKSMAAGMIYQHRVGPYGFGKGDDLLNGRVHRRRKDWAVLDAARNWQRSNGISRFYAVLDEVDRFGTDLIEQLDEYLENDQAATLLMTTNNLQELESWFTSRCRVVKVKRPTAQDFHHRAKSILASEGYPLSDAEITLLLNNFNGDLRSLVEWLEDYSLKLKKATPKLAPPAPAPMQPVAHTINGAGGK
jgi:replication-associated recombination protein RarA